MKKPSLKKFTKIAEQLIIDIEKMIFSHENNEIAIRVTIGGSYLIQGAIEKADIALKSAKNSRKSFLIYDEDLNIENKYKNNMQWVKKLKQAIKDDKIIPYYQPIFDNKSGKLASCECLIRLIDDDEVISPFHFLDIAKKSRLYGTLTKIMLRKSCQYFENIDCDFSVNMSVEDMLDIEVVNYVKQMIRKYDVAQKIVFEILESEGIENYKEVSSFISDMKALGCRIAIDDFGSGYSSFEYILELDVDYIKIDGSLIKNLDSDKNAQVVTQTIVDFAKKLNMLTIAEYVHNDKVFTKVKEFNVDRTQGFYLAEPQKDILVYL
jgi:EAL domain-containing protein (putative c-di-GMP-specific phosphodiesterase class I)